MDTTVSIAKNIDKHPSQDYAFLRQKGLEHIEQLSHLIWTDYNVHDPGITILEILCYALTDLGYRTGFDMKDMLANEPESVGSNFFSAREILTCNPVTLNDFRKLIIDVEGVKNTWIQLAENVQPSIYADYKSSQLTTEYDQDFSLVNLKGLYAIQLELDDHSILGDLNDYTWEFQLSEKLSATLSLPGWNTWLDMDLKADELPVINLKAVGFSEDKKSVILDVELGFAKDEPIESITLGASLNFTEKLTESLTEINSLLSSISKDEIISNYLNKLLAALEVVGSVKEKLHAHRNLCEDYLPLTEMTLEDVHVCIDLKVTPESEIEVVLAQVYLALELFMAPDVPFYTLEELLREGIKPEDIFQGPALDHGFIKDQDLESAVLKEVIHTSDLVQLIMDVEGVVAVKDIQIANSYKGIPLTKGEKWSLPITTGRACRLDKENSKVVFYKGLIPYYADEDSVEEQLAELTLLKRSAKQGYGVYDLDIPEGVNRSIGAYQSIQEEFPLNYGIGRYGIPGRVDDTRTAQALQLKGYLLIMDQLLANFMAQLANVKDVFSIHAPERTQFYQLLYHSETVDSLEEDLPGIQDLLKSFNDYVGDWDAFKNDADNSFVKQLKLMTETPADFLVHRNRMLDHLMARFNEQFSDYVLSSYYQTGTNNLARLVEDKEEFLQSYPTLSHDRGKAFDYTLDSSLWSTDNVSGYEKRLSLLTGIESYDRTTLFTESPEPLFYKYKDTAGEWRFSFSSFTGRKLLGSEGYTNKSGMNNGIQSVMKNGVDRQNYELRTSSNDRYYYVLIAQNGEEIGRSGLFGTRRKRTTALLLLIRLLKNENNEEGFHLMEHILLRPKESQDHVMPVCIEPGCTCPGCVDPYSFRMTLVLPAWAGRFNSIDFRRHFEYSARMEAPAHLHVKICWIEKEDMLRFEKVYEEWLIENAKESYQQVNRQAKLEELIKTLNEIRSVYPEASLHDCEESTDNPVLLGHTSLGSTKTTKL